MTYRWDDYALHHQGPIRLKPESSVYFKVQYISLLKVIDQMIEKGRGMTITNLRIVLDYCPAY